MTSYFVSWIYNFAIFLHFSQVYQVTFIALGSQSKQDTFLCKTLGNKKINKRTNPNIQLWFLEFTKKVRNLSKPYQQFRFLPNSKYNLVSRIIFLTYRVIV